MMTTSNYRNGTWLLVLAAVCAIGQAGCNKAVSAERELTPVRVSKVETISIGNATRYSANIVPNAQVDLAFKSGGYVESIRQVRGVDGRMRNLDTGDWVTRGTVLAVVRQKDYMDQRGQARAQLARAQADYDHAKLNFDRTSILYSSQSATKPDYDASKAQYETASATLDNGKAALAQSQTALDDSSLRAPFDGWIIKRSVDIGTLAGPSSAAFTIADTRSVKAVFGVPDNAIGRIKLGQRQAVATDVFPDQFAGRITAISPAADPKSRVYSVEVTIPNLRNQLKSGMIASLEFGGEALPGKVLAVPLSAVIRDPEHPERFAVLLTEGTGDPTTVRAHAVGVGDAYGNMVQVLSGLKAGDRVVTSGATLVKSGDQVRIVQ
ncbi:MAG TPA: efflux RND transporter periplasmic adaptor subunit [Candidatus Angelobacter sp.]|nr:efflux RND transporter periplasmic adaptor subunit [Candidatus Angelobacter sp.]